MTAGMSQPALLQYTQYTFGGVACPIPVYREPTGLQGKQGPELWWVFNSIVNCIWSDQYNQTFGVPVYTADYTALAVSAGRCNDSALFI